MRVRRLRLVLACALLMVLFLPVNSHPEFIPNGAFIFFYSMEAISGAFNTHLAANRVYAVLFPLGALGAPIVGVLNACLAVFPSRRLKTLLRIYLLILSPLMWYGVFWIDPVWRGIGFWVSILLISSAGIVEFILVMRDQPAKPTATVD